MSKPTRLLLFVLAVLIGLGTWLAFGANEPDAGELVSVEGTSEVSLTNGAHLNVPGSESEGREEVHTETVERDTSSDEAPALVIEPYVTRNLSGTLTLTDEFGNGPFLQSGTFAFWLWEQDETSYHEVQVENGEWETVLPDGVRISLAEVELGGRVAAFIAEDGPPIDVPESGYLELEAYLPKASQLRVYASDTGAELDQITVVVERRSIAFRKHPGEFGAENRVVEGVTSPIEIHAVSGVRIDEEVTYFIKAHGYAWTSLRMRHSIGGTYKVTLHPSGSLEVNLSEFDPELSPAFRLWHNGAPVLRQSLTWERNLAFGDLAEGDYFASVDIGRNWRNLVRLGGAAVSIHAGGVSVVDLELGDGPEYQRGGLSGTIVIPTEWELSSFRILLRLRGKVASRRESLRISTSVELANVAGRDDAWRFHFPDLIAGEWQFGVQPTLYAVNLEVKPGDSEEIEIKVPPPAKWLVRTVDLHTGEPALVDEVRYEVPGGYTSKQRLAAKGDAANEFLIRAPLGRVNLVAEGAGYQLANERFDLDAPQGEIILKVASECGVELVLRSGGRVIPWPGGAWAFGEEFDGEGFTCGEELRDGSLQLLVSRPGVYLLELTDFAEHADVFDLRVVVEAGTFTEVEVDLVRK